MGIKKGIESTRKQYVEKVFNIIKNRTKTRYDEQKVWSVLNLAYDRGFYLGNNLLSSIDNSERLIDVRGYIDTLFDFVSPVDVCFLLTASNQLKENGELKQEKADSVYYSVESECSLDIPFPDKGYNLPSENTFFIGELVDEIDPQNVQVGENLTSRRDYEFILNRRLLWRNDCSIIFNAIWRESIEWKYLLDAGFNDVSDMRFIDHGIDFVSEVLIKAKSRGFVYQSFFINEIPLISGSSYLADCFTQAIQLFISPAELYKMLDLTLVFGSGKYSKLRDPQRIKMKS